MQTNELITNEEMSSLLGPQAEAAQAAAQERRRRIIPYNFRRPDRLSKEQVRSLYLLHDLFSHNLSSNLPVFMRAISEVSLISVEQLAYADYLSGMPDPTIIFPLSMRPLQGSAAIELNPSLAFPIIDRMLGGAGLPLNETRAVSEIEQQILEGFIHIVTDCLAEAWKPLLDLDLEITGRETRPQMLQIVAPNEVIISIIFHVRIGEARGTMNLCLPAVMLEPVIKKFNQSNFVRSSEIPPAETSVLLSTLNSVAFPVAAEIHGTRIQVNDLLNLAAGDVLLLNHRAHQPVSVSVGSVIKFQGDLATQNNHLVVHLCSPATTAA